MILINCKLYVLQVFVENTWFLLLCRTLEIFRWNRGHHFATAIFTQQFYLEIWKLLCWDSFLHHKFAPLCARAFLTRWKHWVIITIDGKQLPLWLYWTVDLLFVIFLIEFLPHDQSCRHWTSCWLVFLIVLRNNRFLQLFTADTTFIRIWIYHSIIADWL